MSTQTSIEIRRRLKARAAELDLDFQQAVLYYAMERFLFRLSQTQWSDRLVVKGAVMLRVWGAAVARPTRDIDFLGRVDNTPEAIRGIVAECLSAANLGGWATAGYHTPEVPNDSSLALGSKDALGSH